MATRKIGQCAVLGYGAVTSAGRDVQSLLNALIENKVGYSEVKSFKNCGYQTHLASIVADSIKRDLRQENPEWAHASAFLLASEALQQATRQAKSLLQSTPAKRIGLVFSTAKAEIPALETIVKQQTFHAHNHSHIIASKLAEDLAAFHCIRGPVQCVSVACISGLVGIWHAASMIEYDDADVVLVTGVDLVSHFVMNGFSSLQSLDPEGCRPFDKHRSGLTLGEGAGAMVLAKKDVGTETPKAFVRGWGFSNDANHLTGPSRDGSGLALAMNRAIKMSGAELSDITYANAHGTGTRYNDMMESLAYKSVFKNRLPMVSSTKGITGHVLGAAGLIESALSLAAAEHGFVPGTAGLNVLDTGIIETVLKSPENCKHPRYVLKTNSGFGGVNGAVVYEMSL